MTSYGSGSRIISYNNSRSSSSSSSSSSNDDDGDVSVLDESIALSPYELSLIYDINNSNNNSKLVSSSSSSHHYIGQNSIFPTSISNDYDSLLASHILINTSTIININLDKHHDNTSNSSTSNTDSKCYDSFIKNCWTVKKNSISTTANDDSSSTTDMVQLSKQIEAFIKVILLLLLSISLQLLSLLSSLSPLLLSSLLSLLL